AIATALSVSVCTTMMGWPRRAGVFLLLARRKEGIEVEEQPLNRVFDRLRVSFFVLYDKRQESSSRTMPPRYAFRLEELRVFRFVRASCRASGRKAIIPNAALAVVPAGLHVPDRARAAAALPEVRGEGQRLVRCRTPAARLN